MNDTCHSYNRTVSIAEVDEFFGEKSVHTETETVDEEEAVRIRREEKKLKEKRERQERDKLLHGENYDYDQIRDIKKAPTLYWGSEEEVAKTTGLEESLDNEESSESESDDDDLLEDLEIDSDISYGRAIREASDSGSGKNKKEKSKNGKFSKEKSKSENRILAQATSTSNHLTESSSLLTADRLEGQQQHRAVRRLLRRNIN